MDKTLWLCPTLGRPKELARFIEAYRSTEATLSIMVRLHEEDPALVEYGKLDYPAHWYVKVGKNKYLADCMNEAFLEFPHMKSYCLIADDIVPETIKWDTVLPKAAGVWGVSYGDDKLQGEQLATHPCSGGELLRELGWWALPGLKHSFVDSALMMIAINIGRLFYLPSVVLRHKHWLITGEENKDSTYKKGNAVYPEDREAFSKWQKSEAFIRLVRRLREKTGLPENKVMVANV